MGVGAEKMAAKGSNWDTLRVVIHALILALIVRVFLFQPSLGFVAKYLTAVGVDWNPTLNGGATTLEASLE